MANPVVYFVTEEKIKSFTAIHENVSITDILPYVIQAQDLLLQPILGSEFYNTLKDQVAGATVSTVNADLLDDFIAPFLLNAALYQMIPFNYVKLKNKGMLKGLAEDATSADIKDVEFYRGAVRTNMEFYAERLRKQLIFHMDLYPTYQAVVAKQNMVPNRRMDYSKGMSIPSRSSNSKNQNYAGGIDGKSYPDGQDPYQCDDCGFERYGPFHY